jgi:hypothetical protein
MVGIRKAPLEELQNAVFVGPRSSKAWSSRGFALTGHGFALWPTSLERSMLAGNQLRLKRLSVLGRRRR